MKRLSIVWLFFVFLVGAAGFAIGTSHNKPRLPLSQEAVNLVLRAPLPQTACDIDANGDGIIDDRWASLKCRFSEYQESVDPRRRASYASEIWEMWENDPTITPVRKKRAVVHYNMATNEIMIVCKNRRCTDK